MISIHGLHHNLWVSGQNENVMLQLGRRSPCPFSPVWHQKPWWADDFKRNCNLCIECTWCLDKSRWEVPVNHLMIVYSCCQPTAMPCSETLLSTCSTPPCPAPIPRCPFRKEGSYGNLDLPSVVIRGRKWQQLQSRGHRTRGWVEMRQLRSHPRVQEAGRL